MSSHIGLVLTGGGARAAYQAGVLKGIGHVLKHHGKSWPFSVIAGMSAGAINSAMLAASPHDLPQTADDLCKIWSNLSHDQVINTSVSSLSRSGARWVRDLSLGGILGKSESTYLIDASPLRTLLSENISFESLRKNFETGKLRGLAISVTSYRTGTAVSFFDGSEQIAPWARSTR